MLPPSNIGLANFFRKLNVNPKTYFFRFSLSFSKFVCIDNYVKLRSTNEST